MTLWLYVRLAVVIFGAAGGMLRSARAARDAANWLGRARGYLWRVLCRLATFSRYSGRQSVGSENLASPVMECQPIQLPRSPSVLSLGSLRFPCSRTCNPLSCGNLISAAPRGGAGSTGDGSWNFARNSRDRDRV